MVLNCLCLNLRKWRFEFANSFLKDSQFQTWTLNMFLDDSLKHSGTFLWAPLFLCRICNQKIRHTPERRSTLVSQVSCLIMFVFVLLLALYLKQFENCKKNLRPVPKNTKHKKQFRSLRESKTLCSHNLWHNNLSNNSKYLIWRLQRPSVISN